jgi:error-prone DNA polymerase
LRPELIHGTELTLACGMKLVLLAQNRAGYGNLSALVTLGRRRARKGGYRLTRNDLAGWDGAGVPDCLALWVAESRRRRHGDPREGQARWLAEALYRPGLDRLRTPPAARRRRAAGRPARAGGGRVLPLVAAGDVHMHVRSRRPLQDALTALRLKTTVSEAGHALFANGERHLRSRLALARLYPPELLAETLKVAALCNFSLDELRYEYPEEVVPAGETPDSWLRRLTERGLARRYPAGVPDKVRAQVEHELR